MHDGQIRGICDLLIVKNLFCNPERSLICRLFILGKAKSAIDNHIFRDIQYNRGLSDLWSGQATLNYFTHNFGENQYFWAHFFQKYRKVSAVRWWRDQMKIYRQIRAVLKYLLQQLMNDRIFGYLTDPTLYMRKVNLLHEHFHRCEDLILEGYSLNIYSGVLLAKYFSRNTRMKSKMFCFGVRQILESGLVT